MLVGPSHIHAQEHLGPILAFGAASSGMNFEEGVVAVGLARQKSFHLPPLNLGPKDGERSLCVPHNLSVFLLFAELDQPCRVIQAGVELRIGRQRRVQMLPLAEKLLRPLRIIPKAWIFDDRVQVCEAGGCFIPVKDTSAGATGIA